MKQLLFFLWFIGFAIVEVYSHSPDARRLATVWNGSDRTQKQFSTYCSYLNYKAILAFIGSDAADPKEKFSVNGNISAKKIIITQTGWSDYVFDPSYQLKPLSEVARYVKEVKHLPDIPSAKEVEEDGTSVGANQVLLLKKIEELTLYLIEMKKEIVVLQKKNRELKK